MNSHSKQHRLEVLAQSHGLAMVFITLAITLSLLVAAYWLFSLEPRLTTQAQTQANTLAQAHAGILAKSLSAESRFISLELEQAMDSILLVRDPATWTPVIHRIELEIDFTVIDTKPDTLELAQGAVKCTDCFISEIPLFHEKRQILVGIARFYAGREFLDTLISDIQQKLWWSGAISMLFIGFAWIVIESFLRKLNKSKSNLQSIIDAVADPLYVFSTERELILQNHTASELSTSGVGIDDEEFQKYIIPSNEMSQDVIQNDRPVKCIHKIPQSHDRFRRMELQASPLSDGDNNSTGIVVTYRDITEHLEVLDELQIKKHQLQQLAEKDTLTELPNRFMFNSLLEQAVARADRNQTMLALLFLDLDRFKEVNDSLGHDAGDTLLGITAKRLLKAVRSGDVVSRLSGDEFVILLEDIRRPEDATSVAQHTIETVRQIVTLHGKRLHPSVSIGISLFPNDGMDGKLLLQNADTAMYRAKRRSRNNYQLYDPSMTLLVQERLNTISELQSAVEEDGFVMLFQPQYELHTKKLIGVEALLRWNRPGYGLVSASQFLDLAEDVGLAFPIGQWVLRNVCNQIGKWRNSGLNPPPIAINISASEILHEDFFQSIETIFEDTDCVGEWLAMEVTENLFIRQVDVAAEVLQHLKATGITIAIDDFGIGYSSLARLKQLPIDRLKLDKIFLDNLSRDAGNQAIIQTVQDLGQRLGIEVLAEGVETAEQETYLILSDYRLAQGHRYGKPMTAEECAKRFDTDR
ncbi:MAG: EAL domain-containing protein [Candidatus Thiodiazotropha sp.]|nr:EAL domain-containing protein [Candidatus Thiodiazotropha sp.]MCM8884246.1 EAL domain-containing protein [Candidatus Thiodiazotropha sp.]MCM8919853.1 EAL domain-containing protein [Candidatus Thiodiazotropha sp.]